MAGTTQNLGLYFKEPLKDGADTFNIQTMLNDNWAILDAVLNGLSIKNTLSDYVAEKLGEYIPETERDAIVSAALPVNVKILETVCEDIELTDDTPSYTFPSAITLDENGLYYLYHKYYDGDGNLYTRFCGGEFSRAIMGYGGLSVKWMNYSVYSVMLTSTEITDAWRDPGFKSVLTIAKVDVSILDKLKFAAMNQEGYNTTASGANSHAEGTDTIASGRASHAEGCGSVATSSYSHVEGYSALALHKTGAHAEGTGSAVAGIDQTLKITSVNTDENAFTFDSSFGAVETVFEKLSIGQIMYVRNDYYAASRFSTYTINSISISDGKITVSQPIPTAAFTASVAIFPDAMSSELSNPAHAEGNGTLAIERNSHAEGSNTIAINFNTHAEGIKTTAKGNASHAEGYLTIASGDVSHAEGYNTEASNFYSHAEGQNTTASNYASHAEGYDTEASGAYSHAEGRGTTASNNESHAEGYNTEASGAYSHAEGYGTTASAKTSHAEGYNTEASGDYSHAEGQNTTASYASSHAEGCAAKALNFASHAEGYITEASGAYSHAEGYGTKASNGSSHAQGKFSSPMNTGGSTSNTVGDAMVIGNGTSDSDLSNAFRVTYAGDVYGLSSFKSSGADYSEFFEWADLNPDAEDRVGFFVTMEGKQIRIAGPGDYILGIVSGQPCIIGNADEDWQGRWVHDEFGRFIREETEDPVIERRKVEVPVLDADGNPTGETRMEMQEVETGEVIHGWRYKANPDYDNTQEYIERKDRQEWDCVGMLGVLAVRDDGSCEVNGYCKVAPNGFATKADTYLPASTYRVIERVTEKVVKIIFK